MIPKWKLQREIERLKVQARAIPEKIYAPFLQRRHDQNREKILKIHEGALVPGDTLAIFLIFPPAPLPASLLQTCRHLADRGVTPVIVSNAPLDDFALETLTPLAGVVMERPNLGYDFGGYRDGLWLLKHLNLAPSNLLFLNDSVWFPAWPDSTLIDQMLAADGDYVGTQVFGDPFAKGQGTGMFGSYCFMVKEPLLNAPVFETFWSQYRLSSNKEVTLRRGERAFSHKMLDAAHGASGLFSQPRFEETVANLPDGALDEALRDMVVLAPDLIARRNALMRGAGARAEAIRALLKDSAQSKNYIGAAPVLSLRDLGFPMIKKNREMLYRLARQRIARAVDDGRIRGLDPVIQAELLVAAHADRPALAEIWGDLI